MKGYLHKMKHKLVHSILLVEILMHIGNFASASDNGENASSQNITVEPDKIKSASGEKLELKCTSPLEGQDIAWISPNGTDINDLQSSRFNDTNGVLTITDTRENDSGTYTCSVGKTLNASAVITIYDMPDYFTEGMIILGINAVLLLVFFGCLAHSTIQNKGAKAHYDKVTSSKA